MSKPILSELEYNADDVASAILSTADLSVTNEDLGVTNRNSKFDVDTSFTTNLLETFGFNGFMFISFYLSHSGGAPDDGTNIIEINDTDFYPSSRVVAPTLGHQVDYASEIEFKTDGNIRIHNPVDQGSDTYYIVCNAWFRYG